MSRGRAITRSQKAARQRARPTTGPPQTASPHVPEAKNKQVNNREKNPREGWGLTTTRRGAAETAIGLTGTSGPEDAGGAVEPLGDEANMILDRLGIPHVDGIGEPQVVLTEQGTLPEGDGGVGQKNDDTRTIRVRADGSYEAGGRATRCELPTGDVVTGGGKIRGRPGDADVQRAHAQTRGAARRVEPRVLGGRRARGDILAAGARTRM